MNNRAASAALYNPPPRCNDGSPSTSPSSSAQGSANAGTVSGPTKSGRSGALFTRPKGERMIVRMLPCPLNEEELLARSAVLVQKIQEHGIEEDDQKEAKAAMKKRLDDLDREIRDTARIVREKREPRPVEVKEEKNYPRRIVEYVRVDTGEVVDSRPMTEAERNVELFPEVKQAVS